MSCLEEEGIEELQTKNFQNNVATAIKLYILHFTYTKTTILRLSMKR